MYMKTGETNEVTHTAASGAEHVNLIPVVASKQYAWYSHTVFENVGGIAAKYKFIGEIDETDINNIEVVSRTLLIGSSFTGVQAQALIDSAGKFLNSGVELKILFEDMTMVVTEALVIGGFTGPGVLTVGSLTNPPADTTTARTVSITNSNDPDISEYTEHEDFDNTSVWDAFLANSALFISGNTCSQVSVYGISASSKVFPVVMASNSSMTFFRRNFCNQINAFTHAEYFSASGLHVYGGTILLDYNKFTTDTDSNGMTLQGCQTQLRNSAGNGSYLVTGGTGVVVAEDSGNTFV